MTKSLETYNFLALPKLNKKLVVELARGEWITRRDNVLALGNSGTGKTHIALALRGWRWLVSKAFACAFHHGCVAGA